MERASTTLPIAPEVFWGVVVMAGLVLACALVVAITPRSGSAAEPLVNLKDRLGLVKVDNGVFSLGAVLWLLLAVVLFLGLFWLVVEILTHPVVPLKDENGDRNTEAVWNWRFKLVQVTALTTVLGALVALPITLIRARFQRRATVAAEESLFNQKIAEATTDLYARRQRTVLPRHSKYDRKPYEVWEDDIARRNAAIDRLEGLVRERTEPEVLRRVSRLLGVYVRELSAPGECPAVPVPAGLEGDALQEWADGLKARSDMENAAQTLGRLRGIAGEHKDAVVIDLQGANLQGCRLQEADFDGARLQDAQLQGAYLSGAQLQGAGLGGAQLQGAHLFRAQLQGAGLGGAQLQGARLYGAQLQGANLGGAQLQGAYLRGAQLQGADLYEAQLQGADLSGAQLQGADLSGAQLQGANLVEAQLQGAHLFRAQLQGARLYGAQLQGARLYGAQLQGANLGGAQLQGAHLGGAQLQGAHLFRAQFDTDTDLSAATLRGAALRSVDDTTLTQLQPFWEDVFADGSVALPDGAVRPEHWEDDVLEWDNFEEAWHRWMRSIGMDPEDPQ